MCPVSSLFYFSLVKVTSRGCWPNCTFRLCHLAPRRCSESQIPCPMTSYLIQVQKWGDNLAQVGFNQEKETVEGIWEGVGALSPVYNLSSLSLGEHGIQWSEGVDMTQLPNSFLHLHLLEMAVSCWQALKLRILIQGLNSNRIASVAPPWPPLGTQSSLILSTTLYERPRSLLRNTMDF